MNVLRQSVSDPADGSKSALRQQSVRTNPMFGARKKMHPERSCGLISVHKKHLRDTNLLCSLSAPLR